MTEAELRAYLASPGGGWRELPRLLASDPDIERMAAALERLAGADPEVDVRYKARKALAALGDHRRPGPREPASTVPAELGHLARELEGKAGDERIGVLERFARGHRGAGVGELVGLLATELDPVVMSVLVRLIGTVGTSANLHDLKRLLGHANPRVVANAVEAMGRLDAGAALPMVLPALVADDHRVRANVLVVLAREWKPEVLGYLTRMAASPKESYRASTIWCLGQMPDVEADEILASRLGTEEEPDLVEAICKQFRDSRGTQAIGFLCRLPDEHPPRAALARELITAIATRHQLSSEQLVELVQQGSAPQAPASKLAGGLRRITRKMRAVLLSRKARSASIAHAEAADAPWWRSGRARLAAAGLVALGLAAVLLAGLPSTPAAPAASPAHPVARAPGPRPTPTPTAIPGGPVQFAGQVIGVSGPTLVVTREYTSCAIRFNDSKVPERLSQGQKVLVTARYRGFNVMQGYVEMDGQAAQVIR